MPTLSKEPRISLRPEWDGRQVVHGRREGTRRSRGRDESGTTPSEDSRGRRCRLALPVCPGGPRLGVGRTTSRRSSRVLVPSPTYGGPGGNIRFEGVPEPVLPDTGPVQCRRERVTRPASRVVEPPAPLEGSWADLTLYRGPLLTKGFPYPAEVNGKSHSLKATLNPAGRPTRDAPISRSTLRLRNQSSASPKDETLCSWKFH